MAIVTTIEGSIAKISIDRPEKRNTLDTEMCRELSRQLIDLSEDNRVRVIMLTGQNNVFCAGLDIEAQVKGDKELFESFRRVIDTLDACTKPIVTAVCGPAVAEGAALLYHCDLIFCGEHAMFSLPSLALGKTPEYGISLLAVKSAGYKLAAQKLLLSEPISAESHRCGRRGSCPPRFASANRSEGDKASAQSGLSQRIERAAQA